MKNKLLYVMLLFSLNVFAQPPAGEANTGDTYGDKTDSVGAVSINVMVDKLKETDTLNTKVKARVLDVCQVKGCWMTLAVDSGEKALVKMKDYGFFVPVALKNKTIVIEGKGFIKTTSVEELRHYAEDAGESEDEIQKITAPEKQIRFIATGIVVVN